MAGRQVNLWELPVLSATLEDEIAARLEAKIAALRLEARIAVERAERAAARAGDTALSPAAAASCGKSRGRRARPKPGELF